MPEMPEDRLGFIHRLRGLRSHYGAAVVIAAGSGLIVAMMSCSNASAPTSISGALPPSVEVNEKSTPDSATDFSKFRHDNASHARLPCLLCHRRETNAPRPTLPGSNGHLPCAGCHAQQFANASSPICGICHTDTQSNKLKPFPRLTSFNMKFDHARHVSSGSINCASCHRPTRAGAALTIPAGLNAHATCYQCHTARATSADRDISSCSVCHELGRHIRARESAPAFKVNFSHAKHGKPAGLTCNDCHRVRAGAPQLLQVSAPQPLNHHASGGALSCMSCHNGKRAFGGDDFAACKRCHNRDIWHF